MRHRISFIAALAVLSLLLYVFFVDRDGGKRVPDLIRTSFSEDVVMVRIFDAGKEMVKLERSSPGEWVLNDSMPADAIAIESLLSKLRRAEVRVPVSVARQQEVEQTLANEGVGLRLYATRPLIKLPGNIALFPRKKHIASFTLADAAVKDGVYIVAGSSEQPWLLYMPGLENGVQGTFNRMPDAWKSPVVLKIPAYRIREVNAHFPGSPSSSYRLTLDHNDFRFVDEMGRTFGPEAISAERLGRFLNAFRELFYEKRISGPSGELPADLLQDRMFLALQVTDIDGATTEVLFFRKEIPDDGSLISDRRDYDPNRFYLKTAHGDYAIALYYFFQPVMRPLSYFLKNSLKQENLPE